MKAAYISGNGGLECLHVGEMPEPVFADDEVPHLQFVA